MGADEEWGDVTGKHFDPQKVVLGKKTKLQELKERSVYSYVDRFLHMSGQHRKLVEIRWALTENGDDARSRFAAQGFAKGGPR